MNSGRQDMRRYRIIKLPGSGFYIPQKSRFPFVWASLIRSTEGLKSYSEAVETIKADVWDKLIIKKNLRRASVLWERDYESLIDYSDPRPPIPEGPKNEEFKL